MSKLSGGSGLAKAELWTHGTQAIKVRVVALSSRAHATVSHPTELAQGAGQCLKKPIPLETTPSGQQNKTPHTETCKLLSSSVAKESIITYSETLGQSVLDFDMLHSYLNEYIRRTHAQTGFGLNKVSAHGLEHEFV